MLKALLSTIVVLAFVSRGCAEPTIVKALQKNAQVSASAPKLLAVYMPWFGDHTHMDVGYSSQDQAVLRKQIQQARHLGISAFVVDWYGESRMYSDHNFALLQQAASEGHFQVALLYNEPEDADAFATDDAIADFEKAYQSYIGPHARYRGAYLTYNGKPMIFIFPKAGHVNWRQVRERCSNWEVPPLFIYKDQPSPDKANDFAGSYAWVQPGPGGWATDGSNWGQQYLENYYKTMKEKHPDKIVVGGVWPGFDDSAAKWGLNRHMQDGCGKTFNETLGFYRHFYENSSPPPFLLIETWNDYEEGTAIERRDEKGCEGETGAGKAPPAQH